MVNPGTIMHLILWIGFIALLYFHKPTISIRVTLGL